MLIIEREACLHKAKRLEELIVKAGRGKAIESQTTTNDEILNPLTFEAEQTVGWDPQKIPWEPAEGAKGPYERSDDIGSSDFKCLQRNLSANQGKLSRDGYYYWTFQDGATIGRKQKLPQATKQQ